MIKINYFKLFIYSKNEKSQKIFESILKWSVSWLQDFYKRERIRELQALVAERALRRTGWNAPVFGHGGPKS